MADNGDDDFFSDDDLDALPANALDELEQNAVYSTQQKRAALNGNERQDISYNTLPTLPSTGTIKGGPRYVPEAQQRANHIDYEPQPSSDYGNFDDEALEAALIDAEEPPAIVNDAERILENKVAEGVTQREQSRIRRYGAGHASHGNGNAEQRGGVQGLQNNHPQAYPVAEDSGYHDYDVTSARRGLPSRGVGTAPPQTESKQQMEGPNELQARIAEVGFT